MTYDLHTISFPEKSLVFITLVSMVYTAMQPATVLAATQLLVAPSSIVSFTYQKPFYLEGEASYYTRQACVGCSRERVMANGQPLDDTALTIAVGTEHQNFLGRLARVTHVETGQSVVVTITDTGEFDREEYGYRIADLTVAAKQAIGLPDRGRIALEIFEY